MDQADSKNLQNNIISQKIETYHEWENCRKGGGATVFYKKPHGFYATMTSFYWNWNQKNNKKFAHIKLSQ